MLLRFLLFLVIFWLVYRFLRRWIVGPFQKGYRQGQPENHQPEGRVTVNYHPRPKNGKGDPQVGEYVDYEELKDEEDPDQGKQS